MLQTTELLLISAEAVWENEQLALKEVLIVVLYQRKFKKVHRPFHLKKTIKPRCFVLRKTASHLQSLIGGSVVCTQTLFIPVRLIVKKMQRKDLKCFLKPTKTQSVWADRPGSAYVFAAAFTDLGRFARSSCFEPCQAFFFNNSKHATKKLKANLPQTSETLS